MCYSNQKQIEKIKIGNVRNIIKSVFFLFRLNRAIANALRTHAFRQWRVIFGLHTFSWWMCRHIL